MVWTSSRTSEGIVSLAERWSLETGLACGDFIGLREPVYVITGIRS